MDYGIFVHLVALLCPLLVVATAVPEKVCRGTTVGLQYLSIRGYSFYEKRYRNCTVVDGNLELTFIVGNSTNRNLDMSFLSSIREVTGYVLVSTSTFEELPLTSLVIIRGEGDLFMDRFSMYIMANWYPSYGQGVGLKRVLVPNLREISQGEVKVVKSPLLCFMDTIDWSRITQGAVDVRDKSPSYPTIYCPVCDPQVCVNCWALGRENCQAKDVFRNCHPSCRNGCFAEGERGCCDEECALGCVGPANTQCFEGFCRVLRDDGACVPTCPPHKYKHGRICVDYCPDYLVKDGRTCATSCPVGQEEFHGDPGYGECLPCGMVCKKRCPGLPRSKFLDVSNIEQFKDCEIVEGSIHITRFSFLGDRFYNRPGLTMEQLRYLSSVREITGYLKVSAATTSVSLLPVRDLSIFENLQVVHGRFLTESGNSLVIAKTPFRHLGLRSLRRIGNGGVAIVDNQNLRINSRHLRRSLGTSAKLTLRGNYADLQKQARGI
ncbi:epidermal growth factor receptor-like [Lineus longissimus]|uniref:epidermal growth factor receptor-like n=1 Tax=Lineus longissimus TaxID=88925 RepID=UPI002B4C56DF